MKMDGRTFVRTFYFAIANKFRWASILTSKAAREDAVVGPFARAAWKAKNAADTAERMAAEEEMALFADSFDAQDTLLDSAGRFIAEEDERDYQSPTKIKKGIFKKDKPTDFSYMCDDHFMALDQVKIWVHNKCAEFFVSRSEVYCFFCVSVSLDNGDCKVFSIDFSKDRKRNPFISGRFENSPDRANDLRIEDHDTCMLFWKKYLRGYNIIMLKNAIKAFFSSESDRELCMKVLKTVYTKATAVFREQKDTAELSYWNPREKMRYTIVLSENNSFVDMPDTNISLSDAVRVPLLRELQRIDAHDHDTSPALVPFDYSPSSPDALFFRECFDLPEKGMRYEDMHGTIMMLKGKPCKYPGKHTEDPFSVTLLFAGGVTPEEIRRHVKKHTGESHAAALKAGLKDAVAEREGRGTFLVERQRLDAKTNYSAQSLEMTEKELQALAL